jgi:hypothetical protein
LSNFDVGRRVHRELEGRYRGGYAPPNLLVTDRRVFGGFPTAYNGQTLSQVAGSNVRLGCCYHAWLNPNYGGKRQWVSNFRGDITDLGRMAQWEIKPATDAPFAVLQETWYRVAYNYVADGWQGENPQLRGQLGYLLPGGSWEQSLCAPPIDVSTGLGIPAGAVAIPITLPGLPGLVLYVVFSGPQLVDIAELALLIYLWLRNEIKRRQEELEQLAKQTEEALRDMCQWIADNWKIVVFIVVIAVIVAFAFFASLGTGNPAPAYGAAILIMFILNRLGPSESDPGPIRPEGSLTTINFPGVSVTMYPQDLGRLLAAADAVYSGSIATIARALRPPVLA